jgi:HPt (histidine-containing phosphotransfer) domain-containing protein
MDDYISKPVRIVELQSALERWGPLCNRSIDTTFFFRQRPSAPESLLDPAMISELREMPPSDGVSMLQELVDLFLQGAPARIAQIGQAIENPSQLAFHAHALKSMSLNLGAKRIVEIAQKLEELGRAGTVDNARPLLKELESSFVQTREQLLPLRDH